MQKTASVTGFVIMKGTMNAGICAKETTFSRVHILTWSEPAQLMAREAEVDNCLGKKRPEEEEGLSSKELLEEGLLNNSLFCCCCS